MQAKVTCILTGIPGSIYAWEQQEDLLIFTKNLDQGLYIEMSKPVIFCLMKHFVLKYQILGWQSYTKTIKPTLAHELQGQCKLFDLVWPKMSVTN